MLNELLKQSSTAQELLAEGRKEGRKEGHAEAVRESTCLVLEGRFQTLSDDFLQAINQADEPTLQDVLKHASSDSLEQVRARLGLHP